MVDKLGLELCDELVDVGGLGFRTGTGKLAVLLKRVWWLRVQYRFLAHRDTPRTRAAVSRVPTGIL